MVQIEQRQEEIIQNQKKQEQYINQLGDLYENLYKQQTTFNQQYIERITGIETQLEGLWVNFIPPLPPPPFDPFVVPPRPPYRAPPY